MNTYHRHHIDLGSVLDVTESVVYYVCRRVRRRRTQRGCSGRRRRRRHDRRHSRPRKRKKPRRKPSRKSGRSSGRPARQEPLSVRSHVQLSELPILISVSASFRRTATSQTTKPTASGWWRRWRSSATAWSWPGTAGKQDGVLLSRFSETQSLICSLQTLNEALTSGSKEQSKAALEKQVRNTHFTLFALRYKYIQKRSLVFTRTAFIWSK